MNRKKILVFFCIISITLSGCGSSNKEKNHEETEISKEEMEVDNENSGIEVEKISDEAMYGHIEVEVSKGPGKEFLTVPMYYQQDYESVELGDSNVAKTGNLVTCLSMIYSYYSYDYKTPDVFMRDYESYISNSGTVDKKVIEKMAMDTGVSCEKMTFELSYVADVLNNAGGIILVRIDHPSKFCKASTWLILTGADSEGNVSVRDPDMTNIKKFAFMTEDGETWYDSFSLCEAIGDNAIMYVFI